MTTLNHILEDLEKIKTNEKNNKEVKEFAENKYHCLMKDKDDIRDSGPRYEQLYELLVNNSVYVNHCKKMSDLELLEFITQYISAPVTPNINQETFEDLVSAGIKKDKRDDYYLTELISAVQEDLNMDELIEKVINTKDTNFIIGCGNRAKDIGIFTNEEIKNLKARFKTTIKIIL